MRLESSKERLWSRLLWPLLWPLLLVQASLVALCLMTGLTLWWAAPAHASWSATFWLTLALLAGSCLTVAIFLILLRQRLAIQEEGLVRLLADHETWLEEASRGMADTLLQRPIPDDPRDRIARLLEGMRTLCEECLSTGTPCEDAGEKAQLLEALEKSERRRDHLTTGRQRAQEESRLKSDFLMHLRQELEPLMASLAGILGRVPGGPGNDAYRAVVRELHDRLSGLTLLLGSLSGESFLPEEAPCRQRSPRVLIVDDGPVNLRLAGQVLEREGILVRTAICGREALACLEQESFDLVLMDIVMQDLDGVETSRRWREIEASRRVGSRSVLIALTANVSQADCQRFLVAGMDDFLVKPYRPQALVNLVKRWLPHTPVPVVSS
jgi:CheY-like chemotaxis protein